jgi:uncharacterized phage protein (TIGR02218 family)
VRSVPSSLATRLATGSSKLAWCVRLTTKTGALFYFTEGDVTATFEGVDYEPYAGLLAGTVSYAIDGSAAGIDLQFGVTADTPITKTDIRDGVFDAAEMDIWEYDLDHPEHGRVQLFWGRVGNIERKLEGSVKLSAKGILDQSHQILVERYTPMCIWSFCDDRCGVDPASVTYAATITAISDDRYTLEISGPAAGRPDNVFLDGVATITGGDRDGVNLAIRGNSGTTLLTHLAVPAALEVGTGLSVMQGCRKIFNPTDGGTGCSFYDNTLRFGGQPAAGTPEEALNITYQEWPS